MTKFGRRDNGREGGGALPSAFKFVATSSRKLNTVYIPFTSFFSSLCYRMRIPTFLRIIGLKSHSKNFPKKYKNVDPAT